MKRIHGKKADAYFALRNLLSEMNGTVRLVVDIEEGKDDGNVNEQLGLLQSAMRDLRGTLENFEQAFKS